MKQRTNKIIITILLALLLYGGFFILGYLVSHKKPVYEGIATFETQIELMEFKADLLDKKAEIRRLDIIMEDPIIINFEVAIRKEFTLSYGEVHYDKTSMIVFPAIIGSAVLLILCFKIIWDEEVT